MSRIVVKQTQTDIAKRLDAALKKGGAFNTGKVGKVGWLSNSTYPSETGQRVTVAEVAAQNEFGNATKGIPPRPTGRPAMKKNQGKLAAAVRRAAKDVLNGANPDNDHVLNLVGMVAAGEWKRGIKQLQEPPLSPRTVKARQSRKTRKKIGALTKPLIDSGIMLGTLTSAVEVEK